MDEVGAKLNSLYSVDSWAEYGDVVLDEVIVSVGKSERGA